MGQDVTATALDVPAGWAGVEAGRRPARFGLVRRPGAGSALETVLVTAVAAVLGIRAYLEAMGYPQVGGGGLHIAHMLWGGLLMLGAVVILLGFLGRPARSLAAVVGGIGFGTFVDELGKFVTQDNDYFFRPTVGLLYVIFVVLFLVSRAMERRRPPTREEALAGAADALPELIIGRATEAERERVLRLLDASGRPDALVEAARAFVVAAPAAEATAPSPLARLASGSQRHYERLIGARWFGRLVVIVFVASALIGALGVLVVALVAGGATLAGQGQDVTIAIGEERGPDGWPVTLVSAGAAVAALVCSLVGASVLRRSRLGALRWFRRSVLITLLLSQPIAFLDEQFGALYGLALNLVLWLGVGYLIRQETRRLAEATAA